MTQHQKIIFRMLHGRNGRWWLPQDFMQGGDYFVGYEASARLSELASEYPDMIDTKQDGKQFARRIKTENVDVWLPQLPKYLQDAIREEFQR